MYTYDYIFSISIQCQHVQYAPIFVLELNPTYYVDVINYTHFLRKIVYHHDENILQVCNDYHHMFIFNANHNISPSHIRQGSILDPLQFVCYSIIFFRHCTKHYYHYSNRNVLAYIHGIIIAIISRYIFIYIQAIKIPRMEDNNVIFKGKLIFRS